jgi:hypothetical protein
MSNAELLGAGRWQRERATASGMIYTAFHCFPLLSMKTDPGYHTGLSIIDALQRLEESNRGDRGERV